MTLKALYRNGGTLKTISSQMVRKMLRGHPNTRAACYWFSGEKIAEWGMGVLHLCFSEKLTRLFKPVIELV